MTKQRIPRAIQAHSLPATGDPNVSLETLEYVVGQPLQGFKPRNQDRDLFGYKLPVSTGNAVDHTVTATIGTRTETVGFSKSSGGIILEWTTVDTGINVQWLNHRGANTRGIGMRWKVTDEDGIRHMCQGGSYIEGDTDSPTMTDLADGFVADDMIQGSIITKFIETDLGGGEKTVEITTIPMEIDPHGDVTGADLGGSQLDPLVYHNVTFETKLWINWQGNAGIHRLDQTVNVPGIAPYANIVSRVDAPYMALSFGFENLHSYRSDSGGEYNGLGSVEVAEVQADPTLTSVESVSDLVTIVYAAVHDRTVGTTFVVQLTEGTPTVINGTWVATATSTTVATMTVPSSGTQSFATVRSDVSQVLYGNAEDAYQRILYRDNLSVVSPSFAEEPRYTADAQEGAYVDALLTIMGQTGTSRNAIIYRALGGPGYSHDNDFAVGMYSGRVVDLTNGFLQAYLLESARTATTPLGNSTELAREIVTRIAAWDGTAAGMAVGPYTTTSYILTGEYVGDVQAGITTLDALSDAVTGLNV